MRRLLSAAVVLSALAAAIAFVDAEAAPDPVHSVRMVFGDDAARQMTIAWATDPGHEVPTFLRYGPEGGAETTVAATRTRFPDLWYPPLCAGPVSGSTCVGDDRVAPGQGWIHRVVLSGLAPGTTYTYQAGSADIGWTAPRTFRTAPVAYAGPFAFTAYGDTYPVPAAEANANGALRAAPAFHLHLGDIAYHDTDAHEHEAIWNAWFAGQQPLQRTGAYMPALGNHDHGYPPDLKAYMQDIWTHWDHPTGGWSFRWGDVVVVSVWADGEAGHRPTEGSADFIRAEFARHAAEGPVTWRILTLHSALYSTGSNHGSDCGARAALEPAILEAGVDLVLNGHEHAYERTEPVKNGGRDPAWNGISPLTRAYAPVYVTSGVGGPATVYRQSFPVSDNCPVEGTPATWSEAYSLDPGHVIVRESADRLRIEFRSADGTVLRDSVEILE